MKQAKGFLANDGTFFNTKEACALYETECDLREASIVAGFNPDALLTALHKAWEPIGRYIDARRAVNKIGVGASDTERAEGDTHSVQQQPSSVGQPVSDVGRGKFKEKVREQRKGDGS
jgi:hypothetical protein